MFYHQCKDKVIRPVYLSKQISIISSFVISSGGISQAGSSKVTGKNKFILTCERCGEIVPTEITSHCFDCGKQFSLSDLYVFPYIAGHYCKSCSEENYPDKRRYVASGRINL